MPLQVQGNSGVNVEVETNTRAMRSVIRPNDYTTLGMYQMAAASGLMAAALATASPIFSFRYGGANLCLVRRVILSVANNTTGFTAGVCTFNMFVARSFSASDTGGTAGTLTAPNGQLRTSMAATGVVDFRISSTATLSAGTRTLDAQPCSTITMGVGVATSSIILTPNNPLWDMRTGEYPVTCANNEGFVIQATVPATGTWNFSVQVNWEELTTTNWY